MDTVTPDDSETVEVSEGVFLTQLAIGERMSIQHLRMEPDAEVPMHDHHHEQLGFVYEGTQTFLLADDETVDVEAGESYYLESGEPHAALNLGEGTMRAIDIFSPPRPNPSWLEG
ncbi:MAG: cupin domain-containing protein [Haloarculaceae archaeon]